MGLAPTKVEQAKAAGRLADKAKRKHYELLRREKERNRVKLRKKKLIISVATIVGVEVIMAGKLADFPNIPSIIGHLIYNSYRYSHRTHGGFTERTFFAFLFDTL